MKIIPKSISKTSSSVASDHHFKTDYLRDDLKHRTASAGLITLVAQAAKFCLQVGSTMILARILTPGDYGLIAMVTAVTAFLMMFKDAGLSEATIQRREINHNQISSLFWINVGVGIILTLITVAVAPAIASFYDDRRLTWIAIALAPSFVFSGLTVQHMALLRRQMRFFSLAIIDISSIIVSIGVGIISAWNGAGYWALVYMQLMIAICTAIGVWFSTGWYPGFPVRDSGIREMLTFGWNVTGVGIIVFFTRNLDNVLIGKFWGTQQVGLYSKAYQLLLLPIQQINRPISKVFISTLSLLQNDPERYRRYYYKALNFIAFATGPLVMIMAALSNEIVEITLGNQWLDSCKIFEVLAIAAFVQPIGNAIGWIFISLGQTGRMMKLFLITGPVVILSFIIGLPWGPLGVAISYTVCTYLLQIPCYIFAFRYSPLTIRDLIKSVWTPMMISLFIFGIVKLTRNYIVSWHPLLIILFSITTGFLCATLLILLWPKARSEVLDIFETIKMLRKKRTILKS
jgi:O-antigen/teichoic acid export membrane protein